MKPYELYTVDDFIEDADFRDWVQGHSDRESFWLSFLDRYPHQQVVFQQAEQLVRAVRVRLEPLTEGEIRNEVQQFLDASTTYSKRRDEVVDIVHRRPQVVFPRWRQMSRSVVALFLIAVVGGYWWEHRPVLQPKPTEDRVVTGEPLVETTNNAKHALRVVLTDGSEVLLSPNSQLRYPARFSQRERIVYLRGEAVFSVKRQTQPFMVYSGDLITKVLGTRFVVRAFESDPKSSVQVLSGKVSVYGRNPQPVKGAENQVKGLILTINQAAIFGKTDGQLTKTLVANPTPLPSKSAAPQPSFDYEEVPLTDILRDIEATYGIPIQYDAQSFESARITAVLTNESLYDKLNLLCKAASASYEITDGQIIISKNLTPKDRIDGPLKSHPF